MSHEGILIGVQYDGYVMDRAGFAREGELLSSAFPPTQAAEKEMFWQEGKFMMKINWGAARHHESYQTHCCGDGA